MSKNLLSRRSALQSTIGLIAAPALAGTTKPRGSATALRPALDAYLDAYRAFFGVPLSALPDDNDGSAESVAIWQGWLDRCRAWRSTREALAAMVLEHAGLNAGDTFPPTILAAAADLGDVLIVVTGDGDYEGVRGNDCTGRDNVSLAPKSLAMQSTIAALPSWDGDEVYDNSFHDECYYESRLEDPHTPEDRAAARAARAEQESRPTRDQVLAAINAAHAADESVGVFSEGESTDDETLEAVIKRQDECWERVRDLARRYAGLPDDFTDTAVTVGDHIVTMAENRAYEMPASVQSAGVDVWTLKRAY